MRTTILLSTFAAALCIADTATAQRGRNRRPEEVTNRVGTFFTDTKAPAVDGDKVADLNTTELVRAAIAANQLTVLYLYDGEAPEQAVQQFEGALFRGDELGIKLRCFHCGRIDVSKDATLKRRYGEQAPLFVVFDAAGVEMKPVSMAGFKADAKELESQLDKAAKGTIKPSLSGFAKQYEKFVRAFEQLQTKKLRVEQDQARADGDKSKSKKVEKELADLADEETKLLEQEQKLLERVRLPERSVNAQRLGRRAGRDARGNTGTGNTGAGNTGRGRTGG